jgi:uncharacterized protein involved in exopolysaccharide biosynthesis
MSIFQFFRIVWARRLIIGGMTALMTVIMVGIVLFWPPAYQAETRVMLEVLKPDPVTGQVMATAFLRAYVKTQIELIQDYQVAKNVVDTLHWDKDKKLLRDYRQRPASDDRDFNRWAAQTVIDGTRAEVVEGSNIMEIDYRHSNPDTAKAVADALRNAYIANTLQSRQEAARRNADWYDAQAEKAKSSLFEAETRKSTFERENNLLLADDKIDIESTRLASLSAQAANVALQPSVQAAGAGAANPQSALLLAQMDAELLQVSKVLGPNHPQLLELRRRRELLAKQVEDERAQSAQLSNPGAVAARTAQSMLEAQKAKVLAQRDKVEQLRLLQDDVNIRREEYNKSAARAAELRQEAEVADAGVTPLGAAVTPQQPVFPNPWILIPVGIGGGLMLGLGLALLLELFGRRIRSSEDLRDAAQAPVLAVFTRPHTRTGLHLRDRLRRWFLRSRQMRARPAKA